MLTARTTLITCLIILSLHLSATIKINEVYYDPTGSDSGYEWIELYNPTDQPVDINGWKIEKAGTSFATAVTLESVIIQPLSFYILGEEFVSEADYICELGLQNGGSATDGIRLISSDNLYTDTILYDEPNSNLLSDDINNPGVTFAPDVSSGHSLARISDGFDSDNSLLDWADCENPTPGSSNIFPIDLEIRELNWRESELGYELFTTIYNLSTTNVDNSQSLLKIYVNDNYFNEYCLPGIGANDSILFSQLIDVENNQYSKITIEVYCINDNDLDNNYARCSILSGDSPFVLNELLFKPLEHSCEWVEIYNRSLCGYLVDNFEFEDLSGRIISFSAYIESEDYLIVCQDSQLVACEFPELSVDKILQPESWINLNNSEETLIFRDGYFNQFDSMSYDGSDCPDGFSFERINPWLGNNPDNWNRCLEHPTPGKKNSIYVLYLPSDCEVNIIPNPFSPYRGENCLITFSMPETLSTVTIRLFDLKGRLVKSILNQQVQAAENVTIWDGKGNNHKKLPVGIYIMLFEATGLQSEKIYRRTETIVIAR